MEARGAHVAREQVGAVLAHGVLRVVRAPRGEERRSQSSTTSAQKSGSCARQPRMKQWSQTKRMASSESAPTSASSSHGRAITASAALTAAGSLADGASSSARALVAIAAAAGCLLRSGSDAYTAAHISLLTSRSRARRAARSRPTRA